MAQQVSRSFQSLFSSHCCVPHGPPQLQSAIKPSRSHQSPQDGAVPLLLPVIHPWMDPARASAAEMEGKNNSWLLSRGCLGLKCTCRMGIPPSKLFLINPKPIGGRKVPVSKWDRASLGTKPGLSHRLTCAPSRGFLTMKRVFLDFASRQ